MMGRSRAFLVPVCVDDTREVDADVPDSFSEAQWTRLAAGRPTREFVERIQSLLSSETFPADGSPATQRALQFQSGRRVRAGHGKQPP